jgi:hypothetical protein
MGNRSLACIINGLDGETLDIAWRARMQIAELVSAAAEKKS